MNRLKNYKKNGKDADELRRNRVEVSVELRKMDRQELLLKRRKASAAAAAVEFDSDDEEEGKMPVYDLKLLGKAAADHSNRLDQFFAVQTIRILLSSEKNPPIDECINGDILPTLLQCLAQDDQIGLQFEAVWALTNIASGTSEQTNSIVRAGAIPLLLNLLRSQVRNVSEQAVWALGNIVGDGPESRDLALQHGLLQPLLALVRPEMPLSLLRHLTWVIMNLCRYKEFPPPPSTIERLLHALKALLQHTDTNILIDAVWALNYLTDSDDQIQMVVDSGLVPRLIGLLGNDHMTVQSLAIRAVGNIVAGSEEQTQHVLNFDVLGFLPELLHHDSQKIRKETLWFLSNIAAGTRSQVQMVLDAGLLPLVLENLSHGSFQVQKEAAWTITNLTITGSAEQVLKVIKEGVVPLFCNLLAYNDVQIIHVVLDGLRNMLNLSGSHLQAVANSIEACEGLDKIEHLQNHGNSAIYQLAFDIIDIYFTDDGGDAPMKNTSFQF